MLSTEKYVSSAYDTSVFESANSNVRQALQQIQQEEQNHGEQLYQYMSSHGMYQTQ
jgi:spore coat protein CotF